MQVYIFDLPVVKYIQFKNHFTTVKGGLIMKEFSKLKKACSRYPELVLRVNEKPKIRKRPKGKAKNGFINKFCK